MWQESRSAKSFKIWLKCNAEIGRVNEPQILMYSQGPNCSAILFIPISVLIFTNCWRRLGKYWVLNTDQWFEQVWKSQRRLNTSFNLLAFLSTRSRLIRNRKPFFCGWYWKREEFKDDETKKNCPLNIIALFFHSFVTKLELFSIGDAKVKSIVQITDEK